MKLLWKVPRRIAIMENTIVLSVTVANYAWLWAKHGSSSAVVFAIFVWLFGTYLHNKSLKQQGIPL